MSFSPGTRVETDKNGPGVVAFCGTTEFSDGEWVGVILDQPKGKNNGTVQGQQYFSCEANYGLFTRASQLKLESGVRTRSMASTALKAPTTALRKDSSSSRRASPLSTPRMSPSASKENLSKGPPTRKPSSSSRLSEMNERGKTGKLTPAKETQAPKMSRESSNLSQRQESPAPNEEKPRPVVDMVKKVEEKAPAAAQIPSARPSFSLEDTTQIERLQLEVKDLSEKLDTLRIKRKEDLGKIKELELENQKMQSLQQLRTKLADENLDLMRQLDEVKKELVEIRDWKEANQDQIHNSAQEMEMALIDKEMAEERLDEVQKEFEFWKEKAEELETNLKILKEEMAGGGGVAPAGNSVQMKQLEAQNEKYKLAVIKLRDMHRDVTEAKSELEKEAEKLRNENSELLRAAEQAMHMTEEAEKRIHDYQEQAEAAMGAEEMVTILTSKNLEMEEKIEQMEKEKEDLEELRDMDEQLAEAQKDIERDLRLDIEGLQVKIQELVQKLLNEEKHSDTLMATILKFRENTTNLNEQIQDLNDQILRYEDTLNGQASEEKSAASLASQLQVNASRVFSEAVERQLSGVELEFARKHIGYLKAFLPDNFSKGGGDNDCVVLNILFPRLVAKAKLFPKLASERFPPVPGGVRREHVTKSHKAEQWGQVAKVAYKTATVSTICSQFDSAIKELSVERLSRLAEQHHEVRAHEKTLDQYIDLLKQGRFDENTSLDILDRAIKFFQNQFSINIGWNGFSCNEYLSLVVRQMQLATAWIKTSTQRILFAIVESGEPSDVHNFLTKFNEEIAQCETIIARLGKHVPEGEFKLKQQFLEDCQTAVSMLEKLCNLAHDVSNVASVQVNMATESDGLEAARVKEIIHASVEKAFGSTLLEKAFEPIERQLAGTKSALNDLLSSLEKEDFELVAPPAPNVVTLSPMLERAHQRKHAAVEAEGLRWQLEKKDLEIGELKKNIKSRIDDIGNYKLRLEMAEARMDSSEKQESAKAKLLESKVEQLNVDLQKQKIEFDEAMDAQQKDMRDLLRENEKLKKSQKNMSKMALLQGIQSMESRAVDLSSPTKSSAASGIVNPQMRAEVQFLELNLHECQRNLRSAHLEISRLRGESARIRGLDCSIELPDVVCGPETLRAHGESDHVLDGLEKEAEALLKEEIKYMVYVADFSKPKHIQEQEKEKFVKAKENVQLRVAAARARLRRYWAEQHPGQAWPTKFRVERPEKTAEEAKVLDIHSDAFKNILSKWGNAGRA